MVFKLHNPNMDRLTDKPYARYIMFEPNKIVPDSFLQMFGQWTRDICTRNAVGAASGGAGRQIRLTIGL